MKMIYQDPGSPPPPSPEEKAEIAEYVRLIHQGMVDGHEQALGLIKRATARFYDDPVFHARVVTAASVAQVEYEMRHPTGEAPPVTELRMAAAVGLLLAEDAVP